MPVTTRSMKKSLPSGYNFVRTTAIQKNPLSISVLLGAPTEVNNFIQETKNLLFQCQIAEGKEAKMRISLQIFKNVNANLEKLLIGNPMNWVKFAATVYSKTTEYYNDMITGKHNDIEDKNLVTIHFQEFMKARKFLESYFINLKKISPSHIDMNDKFIAKAIQELEKELAMSRPRRNVPRVNYTGMDIVEPESEFDGITDIWADCTVDEDPDYVYQEDDEYYEDYDDEMVEDVVQHCQPTITRRTKRNFRPVNYSGMDMCEDDEGSVSVCVVKWKNRVPTYRWVKYPASKANELFDEDWKC
jgi:hypothetical protein